MIRFDDGADYERTMGTWSRLVGEVFLDWLALPQGLRWITSVAATAPLPSCWSIAALRSRSTGSIRPKGN